MAVGFFGNFLAKVIAGGAPAGIIARVGSPSKCAAVASLSVGGNQKAEESTMDRAKTKVGWLLPALAFLALCALLSSNTLAAITPTGNVEPSNPSTWDHYSTDAYIGNAANGTLTLDTGTRINSHLGYIGYGSATTGVVNISGTGRRVH
jgi:hypothetical protein